MDDDAIHTPDPRSDCSAPGGDRISARLMPFANGIAHASHTTPSHHPAFGRDNRRIPDYAESANSADSASRLAVGGHRHYHSDDPSGRGQNIHKFQGSSGRQISFYKNSDGSGYHSRDYGSSKPLRLSNDIEAKFRVNTPTPHKLPSNNHEQAMRPNGDSCGLFKRLNEETHSLSRNNRQGFVGDRENVSGCGDGVAQDSAGFSRLHTGVSSTTGEDTTDFLKDEPSADLRENFKRKQDDAALPQKKVKTACSTSGDDEAGVCSSDLPAVDVAGHGNLLLIGNQNMTVNFFSNDHKSTTKDDSEKCWDWSGTSLKETEVEKVTGPLRKLADALAQHVDHRKVARNLEFPNMTTLEDDLSKLRTMKSSEVDRIFYTLLRWWKSNKFGGDRQVLKEEIGYLLEDLMLTRMRRNLKQYFD